jgi:anthranilate phosphoribosyltransferase
VLAGKPSAFRDAAVMTAGAALVVAGREAGLKQAVAAAQEAIDSGAAEAALSTLVKVSNS